MESVCVCVSVCFEVGGSPIQLVNEQLAALGAEPGV